MQEPSLMQQSPVALARQNGLKARDLSPLRLLLPLISPYKKNVFFGLLGVLAAGGCTLAIGRVFQHLVDSGLNQGNPDALSRGLWMLLGLIAILAGASYVRLVLLTGSSEQIMADLRRKLLGHMLHLDMDWFERQKTGDLMARMTADIAVLQVLFGTSLPVALRNTLLVSGGLLMMALSSLTLSGMVLLLVPVLVAILYVLGPAVRRAGKTMQEQTGMVGAHLNENLHAIREIQAFVREDTKQAEFSAVTQNAVDAAWRYVRRRGLLSSMIILSVFSGIAGLLWVGGKQVMDGTLSPGQLSAFVFYALLVAGSVGSLSEIYSDLLRAAGALERLDDIMRTTSRLHKANLPQSTGKRGELQAHDVSFAYVTRPETMALEHINLTFHPGQITAIVGPSGSGKTSLFSLLLRFYDPQQGRITLDGQDIRQLDLQSYRRHFALVPQDPTLFSTSIRDNIAFGLPDSSHENIVAAAQAAGAHDFILRFPQGYDTILGERGTRLSGGQAQRIALARALLRDPQILLLDEATAHLDTETEFAVHDALRLHRQNRTTLIIAHRLSTIRHADRILVLDNGHLVADGSHQELLNSSALYQRLVTSQFSGT